MKNLLFSFLFVFGTLLLLSGCMKRQPAPAWVSKVSSIKEPIGPEEIFALPEAEKISFNDLLSGLDATTVVYVGETHDQMKHHEIQERILQALVEKGKEVVLGMEMFQRSQQPILDQWSEGLLTEEEFLKQVEWENTWGMDYSLYKGILDQARRLRLKVLGLNIERDLVRKVAETGVREVSNEDRRKLPEMDLGNKEHRAYMKSIYRGHHGGAAGKFEYFYQAQVLWDEAMAEVASEFLRSSEGQGKTLLILAGRGHVVFDFGIPKRLFRRIPVPHQTVVLAEWKRNQEMDFIFSESTSPIGDYLWITKTSPHGTKGPRIGVVLKVMEEPRGVSIESVLPGSPADKAGLLAGDLFLAMDGKEIKEIKDIHHAIAEKGWGKDILLTILREGLRKEIPISLPPSPD